MYVAVASVVELAVMVTTVKMVLNGLRVVGVVVGVMVYFAAVIL